MVVFGWWAPGEAKNILNVLVPFYGTAPSRSQRFPKKVDKFIKKKIKVENDKATIR